VQTAKNIRDKSVWPAGIAGAFLACSVGQKKEDRLCGKVGLLLRRKEIRVVLLSCVIATSVPTFPAPNGSCFFLGLMGLLEGLASGMKRCRSTNFLTVKRGMDGECGFCDVVSTCCMGASFFVLGRERFFCWEGLKILEGASGRPGIFGNRYKKLYCG
jgi:hypothetical protein